MRVREQKAFILHRRPFSETSLMIDIFTSDYGRLTLLAKGARRQKTRHRGLLQPFLPLLLSWSGKGEMPTLTGAELTDSFIRLSGKSLYCGFYMNELLMKLLHRHDPHENLFSVYETSVLALANGDEHDITLRLFEKNLLKEIGYAMQLNFEADSQSAITAEKTYDYVIGKGPTQTLENSDSNVLSVSGETLLALAQEVELNTDTKRESKRLTRSLLEKYLEGKRLHSRILYAQAISRPAKSGNDVG